MSAETRQYRYGQGAVYGSLAYDFNNPELYPDMTFEPAPEVAAPPRTEESVGTEAQYGAAIHSRQSIAPGAILGYLCAGVLLILYLVANIQLTAISGNAVELTNQIEELEFAQKKLLIAYESEFNLAEIEEYATTQLGMQKPRSDQVYYVDSSAPDKAVVIDNSKEELYTVKWQINDMLNVIGEYFR